MMLNMIANVAERLTRPAHLTDLGNDALLFRHRIHDWDHLLSVAIGFVVDREAERNLPAKIFAAVSLIALHVGHALADLLSFELSKCCGDRHEDLGHAVAGELAEIEGPNSNFPSLQLVDCLQGVDGRPEEPVQLRCNNRVADLEARQQGASAFSLAEPR